MATLMQPSKRRARAALSRAVMLRMLRTSRFIVKHRDRDTSNSLLRILDRSISKHASVWVPDALLLESGMDTTAEDKGGNNPEQPLSVEAMEKHFCERFYRSYSRRCEMEEKKSNAPPPPPPPPYPVPNTPPPLSPNAGHLPFWSREMSSVLPPLPMLSPSGAVGGGGELSPLPDLCTTPPRAFSLTDFATTPNQTPSQTPGRDALGTPSMLLPDVCRCGSMGVRRGSSSLFASPMQINELFE